MAGMVCTISTMHVNSTYVVKKTFLLHRMSQKIDESLSLLGCPHYMELLDSEKALLLQAGAHPPEKVMTYPKLLLGNHRVLVAEKRTSATKRNDSCLLYKIGESDGYGIVQKIMFWQELATVHCYLLLKSMEPAPLKLCDDQLTHAELSKHFIAFCPPRFVVYITYLKYGQCSLNFILSLV